jgi:hypothetical protein
METRLATAPGCRDPGCPDPACPDPACQDPAGPETACHPGDLWQLPGTPWSLRTAGAAGSHPAVEVYAGGTLLDVVVATPLSATVLRGARRAAAAGRLHALAWGRLPADGPPITVEFRRPGLRRPAEPGQVTEVGWWFWVAVADGRFGTVSVTHRGGRERRHLRGVRL